MRISKGQAPQNVCVCVHICECVSQSVSESVSDPAAVVWIAEGKGARFFHLFDVPLPCSNSTYFCMSINRSGSTQLLPESLGTTFGLLLGG